MKTSKVLSISGRHSLAVQTVTIATSWIVLYSLNFYLVSSTIFSKAGEWIFLPAAVRVAGVLFFGWRAIPGLILGALVSEHIFVKQDLSDSLAQSVLGALLPAAAIRLCISRMVVPCAPEKILLTHFLALLMASAAASAVVFGLFAAPVPGEMSFYPGLAHAFVGEVLGAMAVFTGISVAWRVSRTLRSR